MMLILRTQNLVLSYKLRTQYQRASAIPVCITTMSVSMGLKVFQLFLFKDRIDLFLNTSRTGYFYHISIN